MRLGIFGGTFDPVHIGHLILAEYCREDAALDQVLFVPAARPPHKDAVEVTPFAQRVEMLALAGAGQPAFAIDPLEKDRGGPSFTADTLALLHERQPNAELCLIIGSDSLHDFPSWYQPQRIVELATLVIVRRPDWPLVAIENIAAALLLPESTRVQALVVDAPLLGISSSDIRRRVREGRSIRYLVPRAVEVYIHEKRLYRE